MVRLHIHPKTALAVTASLIVVGAGVAAAGSAGATTTHAAVVAKKPAVTVIRACDNKRTKVLAEAKAGKCGKGWSPVAWDVKGPQGATGRTGATGKTGPTGPVGPAGIAAVTTVQSTATTVLGMTQGDSTAWCPAGQTVLSGGIDSGGTLGALDSFPDTSGTDQGWSASVSNITLLPHTFTVYAVCATIG